MKYAVLFMLVATPALAAADSIVVTTFVNNLPVVNSYCKADGIKWAERGWTCHANPSEREPVVCAAIDENGEVHTPWCWMPNDWSIR